MRWTPNILTWLLKRFRVWKPGRQIAAAAGFSSVVSLLPSFPPLIVCPSDQPPSFTVGLSCCFNYICRGGWSYIIFLSLPVIRFSQGCFSRQWGMQWRLRGGCGGCRGKGGTIICDALQRHPSGHIGMHPHMSGGSLGDDRRLSWKQWRALSALQCAQCARLFYPLLKGIRSTHRAFIKDTLCVSGRQLKSSSPPTLPQSLSLQLLVAGQMCAQAECMFSLRWSLNGTCTSHTRCARSGKMPLQQTAKTLKSENKNTDKLGLFKSPEGQTVLWDIYIAVCILQLYYSLSKTGMKHNMKPCGEQWGHCRARRKTFLLKYFPTVLWDPCSVDGGGDTTCLCLCVGGEYAGGSTQYSQLCLHISRCLVLNMEKMTAAS